MKELYRRWRHTKYTPLQTGIMALCLILGLLSAMGDDSFTWSVRDDYCLFSYVEPGEYQLKINCIPSGTANEITVFSEALMDEYAKPGRVLLSAVLEPGETSLTIPLSLEEGVYDLEVRTALDPAFDEESGENKISLAQEATLFSASPIYRDGAFLAALCLVIAFLLAFVFRKVPAEQYRMPLAAVGIGLLAGIPLYVETIAGGHDFLFHLDRLEGLYRAMAAGDFPVRLNGTQINGYGYLSATMYPQLFLYPFAALRFLHVSLMTSWKLLLVSINVGTALISYYAIKNVTQSKSMGILMSFLYTFSAYRLVCIYVRAAIGEVLAMAFLPLLFWGVYECLWGGGEGGFCLLWA